MNKLEEALNLRFDSDAGDNLTLREYFQELLITLWQEEEGFSGKRPFGNSGWKYDVFALLSENGFVEGDEEEANDFVIKLIKKVFEGGK